MLWLYPIAGFAEDDPARLVESEPVKQMDDAWQSVRDFEETRYFSVAGPPTQEDADRAIAETKLFEDMVENYDDLEDEDDEYLFVIESLFDPEDTSRPASLRADDSDGAERAEEAPVSSSMYIDSVRPTFFPGFQIKPRIIEPDKKDVATTRSLFADILKPKADEILSDEKPILAIDPDKPADGALAKSDDKLSKVGSINAPPKQRAVSPDEETLIQLKQAVKQLGLEKSLNLGSGADGHQVLENKVQETAAQTNPSITADNAAAQVPKEKPIASKGISSAKKKSVKPRKRMRTKTLPDAAPAPAPQPKEESIFDLF